MARYIDAQKLKKRIECYPPTIREAAMYAIAHTKTEDVQPVRHGRWIETKTGFRCSGCKGKAKGTKDGALLSPYCPNCGAKMDGGGK